jgi:hypothetical protein
MKRHGYRREAKALKLRKAEIAAQELPHARPSRFDRPAPEAADKPAESEAPSDGA